MTGIAKADAGEVRQHEIVRTGRGNVRYGCGYVRCLSGGVDGCRYFIYKNK